MSLITRDKVIALDIDGTVLDYGGYITKHGAEFLNKPLINPCGYDIAEKFGVDEDEENEFWYAKFDDYTLNCPVLDGVAKAIRWLRNSEGYTIAVASHRLLSFQSNGVPKPVYARQGLTIDVVKNRLFNQLQQAGIPIDVYYLPTEYISKAEMCNKLNATYLFDDHPKEVPMLKSQSETKAILVSQTYNKHIMSETTLDHWNSIKGVFKQAEKERKGLCTV